jgi:hypothetical protein
MQIAFHIKLSQLLENLACYGREKRASFLFFSACSIKEFLPKEYAKGKGIEKKIYVVSELLASLQFPRVFVSSDSLGRRCHVMSISIHATKAIALSLSWLQYACTCGFVPIMLGVRGLNAAIMLAQ